MALERYAAIRRAIDSASLRLVAARATTTASTVRGTGPARRHGSEDPMPVRHQSDCISVCTSVQFQRRGAGDDVDRVRAAGQERADAALGEGLPVQLDQRLRPAEPRALPRGQQNPGN